MEVASDQQKQKPQEAQIHDTGAREIDNLMINASNAWPCNGGNAMSKVENFKLYGVVWSLKW